jgi:hypothetical protein
VSQTDWIVHVLCYVCSYVLPLSLHTCMHTSTVLRLLSVHTSAPGWQRERGLWQYASGIPFAFDPLDGSWLLIRVVYLRRTLASYPSILLFAGLGRGFIPVGPLTSDPSPFLWPLLRSKVNDPFIEIPLPR